MSDGLVKPLYSLKSYGNSNFQVNRFKRSDPDHIYICPPKASVTSSEQKLDNNFARARSMVKQYGLCNPWGHFITLTLDGRKYDRYDLPKFVKDFQQFVRDERKRLGCNIKVLFVPENHKDGAWHVHGFINGLPDSELSEFVLGRHPDKLVYGDYLNWERYSEKFGFCSLAPVNDQYAAVMYATKYINKDVEALRVHKGMYLYHASRGLRKAETVAVEYEPNEYLDSYITYEGPFVSTGMVIDKDWTFAMDYEPVVNEFFSVDYLLDTPEPAFVPIQMKMEV